MFPFFLFVCQRALLWGQVVSLSAGMHFKANFLVIGDDDVIRFSGWGWGCWMDANRAGARVNLRFMRMRPLMILQVKNSVIMEHDGDLILILTT